MKTLSAIAAGLTAALALAGCASSGPYHYNPPRLIAAALSNPARPPADVQRDPSRRPGELMAFAKVRPGEKVADLMPGAGYFTRIFSPIVGRSGHVYAVFPQFMADFEKPEVASIKALQEDKLFDNITFIVDSNTMFSAPEALDLIWTSQNYHDCSSA